MNKDTRGYFARSKGKTLLILIFFLFLFSCSPKPKDQTEMLLGRWTYVDNENGYNAFYYDIEFVSDGTFLIPDSPFLLVNTFEYGLLEDNRLKLTESGKSEIVPYELIGDTLKLFFEEGFNLYHRYQANLSTSKDENEQGLANPIWEEGVETKTIDDYDMEMILIPAGEFQMGCDTDHNGGVDCLSVEQWKAELPLHTVYLDEYYIDKVEVTNSKYRQCVDSGVCSAPADTKSYSHEFYFGSPEFDNYPVIYVSWYQAKTFCEWAGKRLPTEAEWEKAARGTTPIAYPWGDNQPDCNLANLFDNPSRSLCVGDTSEVGTYPEGASPFGVLDMAGNVDEWVSDWFGVDFYSSSSNWLNPTGPGSGEYKAIRGGRWDYDWLNNRTASRHAHIPNAESYSVGFRCVSDPTNSKNDILKQSSFVLPDDGIPNNNSKIGPFCCTGRTLIISDVENLPLDYTYFYGWDGQAYNVGNTSIAPNLELLLSGIETYESNSPHLEDSLIFSASELTKGVKKTIKVGILSYEIEVISAELTQHNGEVYFFMDSPKLRVSVEVNSP